MKGGAYEGLAILLGIPEKALVALDRDMAERTGRRDVVERVETARRLLAETALRKLGVRVGDAVAVERALMNQVMVAERATIGIVERTAGRDKFEGAAALARAATHAESGWFLKRARIGENLRVHEPTHLLSYLGYGSVAELLEKEDSFEVMSVLRFMESDEWMHELFRRSYQGIGPEQFETRPIEIRVLGPRWQEIAERFVAKKHHNVSHLKEFGVIFVNPIAESAPGAFMRDFSLLFHYFHEIQFYASLFRRYAGYPDFADRVASLLRGDIKELGPGWSSDAMATAGEWLIIQRYLVKEDLHDVRLALPHMNPESLHWRNAERDLVAFGKAHPETGLAFWEGLDWVGTILPRSSAESEAVSFDLEDVAMSLVAAGRKEGDASTYHMQESLWTELCAAYAGGETELRRMLVEQFERGMIKF